MHYVLLALKVDGQSSLFQRTEASIVGKLGTLPVHTFSSQSNENPNCFHGVACELYETLAAVEFQDVSKDVDPCCAVSARINVASSE